MSEPMTRTDLMAAMIAGRGRWDDLLNEVGDRRLEEPGAVGTWSVKQVIAHINGWDSWAAGLVRAVARGEEPPPPEQEEQSFTARNATAVERLGQGSAGEVRADSDDAFANLLGSVELLTNEQLALRGFAFWSDQDTISDIVSESTFKHYQEHGEEIRKWLEQQ